MGKSSIDINNYYDEEVVVHIEDDVIFVYRDSEFFKVSSNVEKNIRSLNITPLEKKYLTRKFFSNSYPDKVSKRGELRIDDSFLKNIAVDGNIYVTHKDNKVEIHGKKDKEVNMFSDYLDNKIALDKWQKLGAFCLTVVASGLFGWIYEFFFYYINFGMNKFYWQGGNFLPWINIYAYGAIMIMILVRKYKRKPLLVFLIAFFSTGVLEYFSGYVIYNYFGGLRLWNYNTEIWNFLNIDGFVCFRSAFFFGLSSFILVYLMIPAFIYLARHLKRKTFLIISFGLLSLVLFDEVYNLLIARIFSLPRARDIYSKIGFNYMNYK